ncbi:MAG: tetratricopeptide repeat protein [Oscillatoria sp. SIO1A7]|nr:tetratricopeptide repeat protein [Oscillatoria sp. SIO1A7]
MNEQRLQAYLALIKALLESPGNQRASILEAHSELIDAGLVQAMRQVAASLEKQGYSDAAAWLVSFAENVDKNNEALQFLFAVFRKIAEGQGDPQVIYPLLQQNQHLLDENLIQVLNNLAIATLPTLEPEQAQLAAAVISEFGNLVQQFPLGSKANNMEVAIACYERALQVCTASTFPEQWAATQNNLGNAYSDRIKGERADNLERAIACHKRALKFRTSLAFPEDWAMTQNNLGNAYQNRIKGERGDNLEQAIACYKKVLQVYTPSAFPDQWAMIQNHLGSAYRNRIKGERGDNLEQAIACYKEALQLYTASAFPQYWALTQNNLGNAYSDRIKGERGDNLEQAIACYKEALQIRTPSAFPEDWAMTQDNLGSAYCERIKGERVDNLEQAIACYELALQIRTPSAFPKDWATTQNNLGIAYLYRIKGEREDNLEQAIRCCERALQIRTLSAFPQDWAMTQNNLGLAYSDRIQGERGDNLEKAIACYEGVLQVYTPSAFPQDWAMTQNNLGSAYKELGKTPAAIRCCRFALEVLTPAAFPLCCLKTGCNLGNLGFTAGDWHIAIEGYGLAIKAVEQSRNWATSDASRQEITKKAIGVYEKMVQACVNSGQLDRALETVERSRSKRLVDLMASNDLYRGGEIPPEIQNYLNQYQNLQKEIDRERYRYDIDNSRELTGVRTGRPYRAGLSPGKPRLVELEARKQEIWQKLRRKDPVLAGQIQVNPLDFNQLQQLLGGQRETAILSFYSTAKDIYIFILRYQPEEDKVSVSVRSCSNQGYDFQNWILEQWLKPYVQDNFRWQGQMESVLAELARRLQIDELIEQHLAGIQELILVPHLALHQIPFAALPLNSGGYLGDSFRIRTVPSCQVLQFCQNRPPAIASKYGTVEDATEDLPYARFEGERIARLYDIPPSQRLQGRRQATVSNYQHLARQVQALHSSHHAESRLDNPLESKLILGDGDITLGQLMTPGWRLPELVEVFLSCCETGLGNIEITDDILTIAAGFLCAGARSVVSTLWAVDDLATAVFSLIYYRYRQQNLTRSAALQRAQQDLRQLTGDEFARVYGSELQADLEERRREKLPELEAKYKEVQKQLWQAKKTLKKSNLDSEREELEQKIADLKKVGDPLHKAIHKFETIQKRLEAKSREPYPFAALQYWAAFVCQGMAR